MSKNTARGPTIDGRFLTIVFELKGNGIARIITAWDMERTENSLILLPFKE